MFKYFFMFLVLSGCSISVGLGVHPRNSDAPEFNSPNPIGIVEGTTQITDRIDGFCTHMSSIPQYESGYGLNMCGIKMSISE